MNARTYTVGEARVLEIPGKLDLTVNVKSHRHAPPDITVGLYEPHSDDVPFRPALAWTMGHRALLQDDSRGNEAFAALWIDDTVFRVSADHIPALLNFLGPLVRDARAVTTTGASA